MSNFDPVEDNGHTVALYEHWEHVSGDEYYLMQVVSSPYKIKMTAGDKIIRRRWAPAGFPEIYNEASFEEASK